MVSTNFFKNIPISASPEEGGERYPKSNRALLCTVYWEQWTPHHFVAYRALGNTTTTYRTESNTYLLPTKTLPQFHVLLFAWVVSRRAGITHDIDVVSAARANEQNVQTRFYYYFRFLLSYVVAHLHFTHYRMFHIYTHDTQKMFFQVCDEENFVKSRNEIVEHLCGHTLSTQQPARAHEHEHYTTLSFFLKETWGKQEAKGALTGNPQPK